MDSRCFVAELDLRLGIWVLRTILRNQNVPQRHFQKEIILFLFSGKSSKYFFVFTCNNLRCFFFFSLVELAILNLEKIEVCSYLFDMQTYFIVIKKLLFLK